VCLDCVVVVVLMMMIPWSFTQPLSFFGGIGIAENTEVRVEREVAEQERNGGGGYRYNRVGKFLSLGAKNLFFH